MDALAQESELVETSPVRAGEVLEALDALAQCCLRVRQRARHCIARHTEFVCMRVQVVGSLSQQ